MTISIIHAFNSPVADGTTLYTGNITSGSAAITSVSPTPPSGTTAVGYKVYGTGIPTGTTITSVSGTTINLSANATATTTGLSFYTGDNQVQPSDWNAQHTLTLAAGKLLGRDTSGAGAVQELPIAVDTSGNVGIGTTSPYTKLDVSGAAGLKVYYAGGTDGNSAGSIVLGDGARSGNYVGLYRGISISGGAASNALTLGAYDYIGFNVSAAVLGSQTERMRINSSGNVGIGTTSPGGKLEAVGSSTVLPMVATFSGGDLGATNAINKVLQLQDYTYASSGGSTTSILSWTDSQGSQNAYIGVLHNAYANANGTLIFANTKSGTFATESMRIDSSGNVGIGTASPSSKLHVASSVASIAVIETTLASSDNVQLRFKGVSGDRWAVGNNVATGGTGLNFDIYDLANSTNRFRIDSSGRVTMPGQPMFFGWRNGTAAWISPGSGTVVVHDYAYVNVGSCYNTSNGRFVAPISGNYRVTVQSLVGNGGTYGTLLIYKNGVAVGGQGHLNPNSTNFWGSIMFSAIVPLVANDYITHVVSGGTSTLYDGSGYSSMSVELIS
jgi:hypothetical protein